MRRLEKERNEGRNAGEAAVRKTKIFYGTGDPGNALINSAIQFYLMKFYAGGALVQKQLMEQEITDYTD